ncbi:hypothetical protein [Streptomyces winkii]|uniref:hypothetical protein n=1 Tax=Streptomyces winkii TaxID=3051178 RepID=UPI0028D6435C|nr:hypothetical protein [Streptomyces sp. DSM 40971]
MTGESIVLASGCTYTLNDTDNDSDGLPEITGNVQISSQGSSTIRRSPAAADEFRIFHVKGSGSLTLNRLTVSGGRANQAVTDGTFGGGIYNQGGTLTLNSTTVTGNEANRGGGVYNSGTLTMQFGALRLNKSTGQFGGGLNNQSSATLNSAAVEDNTSVTDSGGIENCGAATLRLNSSTLTGNKAGGSGGGMYHCGVTARFVSSQVSGNTAASSGGGIFAGAGGVTLTSSQVTGNSPDNCAPPGAVAGCTNPVSAFARNASESAGGSQRHRATETTTH